MGVTPLDYWGKGIRIDPRYLLIDRTVNNGNSAPNNNGRYEEHITMQFSGIYSFNNHISIIAAIPYSIRNGRDDYNSSVRYIFTKYLSINKYSKIKQAVKFQVVNNN